jgi:hypothetical protein
MYVFCTAGILLSLNLFRLDLFRTLTRQAEQPVGTITFKYKAAQRRFVDRVLWDRLRRESPVYDGDFIRTADLSEATITFAWGVIDLEENSLIQIHGNGQGARIEIDSGSLSAAADFENELLIVSGDNEAAIGAGGAVRAGVEGGDFMLRVTEGSASFTGRGESGTVSAGETLVLGGTGLRTVRKAAALSPRSQARLLSPRPGKREVSFRWSRVNLGADETVRLEIAEDRSFSRIVFGGDFAGDRAMVDLEPGSYFWRVLPGDEDPSGVSSFDTLAFRVIAAPAPVLITPAEGYSYQFRVRRPQVRFQWTEVSGAVSYALEVADNPRMTNPALVRDVRGTSLYSPELGPGTWYWRVRPLFPASYEGSAGEAAPASFRISQSGNLRAPELQVPRDRSMANIAGDLYFSWRPEAEARSYTIQISGNPDMRNPVLSETVRDNFYSYRAGRGVIGPGQYYWTVLQTDTEGNDSTPSPARSFTALEGDLIQRLVFPPEGYTAAAAMLPDLRFTWKTNLVFQTRFQISAGADFSSVPIDEAVNGETFQGRILPEGTWYWRIQARESGGMVFETPARPFIVAPPIPGPVLVTPGPGGRVTIREEEPAVFSWEAVEGAEYYQLKLYRGEDRNPVYQNNFIEGTEHSLSLNSYPDGNYRWTVQGFAPESSRNTRRTGLLSEASFVARKLRSVSLDYPGSGAGIDGLRAYREPETARWSSADEVGTSQFILSSRQDLSGPPVAVINNPPAQIRLPRLRPGNYYWTIRAESFDGFDISAGTPNMFRVLPIPLLPAAADRRPGDGTLITGAELKANRSIVFSWNAVPGASGYLFSLENEDTGKVIVREGPLEETVFTLKNLGLLDRGAFVWRIEAVLTEPVRERREETDEILQRGETGENRFSIEFNLPEAPELQRPGVLYGRE